MQRHSILCEAEWKAWGYLRGKKRDGWDRSGNFHYDKISRISPVDSSIEIGLQQWPRKCLSVTNAWVVSELQLSVSSSLFSLSARRTRSIYTWLEVFLNQFHFLQDHQWGDSGLGKHGWVSVERRRSPHSALYSFSYIASVCDPCIQPGAIGEHEGRGCERCRQWRDHWIWHHRNCCAETGCPWGTNNSRCTLVPVLLSLKS